MIQEPRGLRFAMPVVEERAWVDKELTTRSYEDSLDWCLHSVAVRALSVD
jgi:hypothetical protein